MTATTSRLFPVATASGPSQSSAILLGKIGIGSSLVTLLCLLWSTNTILHQIELVRLETEQNAAEYLMSSSRTWSRLRAANSHVSFRAVRNTDRQNGQQRSEPVIVKGPEFQALKGCQKCNRLTCPVGPIGLPGLAGPDGTPGTPGKMGVPGTDGIDLQENPLPDPPCIVCPAGSPGPRGLRGERGWPGPAGPPGKAGFPGQPGPNGATGNYGPAGRRGIPGEQGKVGSPGENVVGGLGVKGPPGKPGPEGQRGVPGLQGRPSNIVGTAGKQGPQGVEGAPGEPGDNGQTGYPGLPGDMSPSPTYCPMACPFRVRGQPMFVPSSNNDYVFPLTMMNHDEVFGEEEEEEIFDNLDDEKVVKTKADK